MLLEPCFPCFPLEACWTERTLNRMLRSNSLLDVDDVERGGATVGLGVALAVHKIVKTPERPKCPRLSLSHLKLVSMSEVDHFVPTTFFKTTFTFDCFAII